MSGLIISYCLNISWLNLTFWWQMLWSQWQLKCPVHCGSPSKDFSVHFGSLWKKGSIHSGNLQKDSGKPSKICSKLVSLVSFYFPIRSLSLFLWCLIRPLKNLEKKMSEYFYFFRYRCFEENDAYSIWKGFTCIDRNGSW